VQRTLSVAGTSTAEAITAGAREAHNTLVTASATAAEQVKSLSTDVQRSLTTVGASTAEAITAGAREAQNTLVTASTTAAEQVKSLSADVQRTLTSAGNATAETITAGAREAQNTLINASATAADHVKTLSADIQRTLSMAGAATAESVTAGAREAQNTLVNASSEAAKHVKTLAADVERTLTAVGADTAAALLSNAREAQSLFASTSAEHAGNIRSISAEIERSLASVAANSSETIQSAASAAQGAIQTSAANAQNVLVSASNEVAAKIKSTTADVERSVLAASSGFGSTMTGKTDEIVTYVTQTTDRLSQMIDGRRGALVEALTARTNQLSTEIDRVTADSLKAIETRGQAFSQAMGATGTDVARSITSAGELATGAVGKSLKELEQASRAAIDQSRQVSIAAVTEMQETSKILRTDTVALFERLREGNILLQEVLTGAQDNLNSLERALVTRVADFVSAMNDVTARNGVATQTLEDQLSVFNDKTAKALADLNALSSQFDSHGKALVEAAAIVEQANRSTSNSVAERKSTLESLVTTIDLRTADLDQRLSRFTSLLDESLAAAEERARDIARVVAETAGAGSAAISRQFEAVRAAAENERQQTLEAMQELYQQSAAETDHMFKESTDKFSAMVHAMKQMASEMHSELEATRNELRRGVLEMPQEAAESTAQMRKVIVDQIEALAELNRIVAHHGRGLDVVTQGRASVRQEEPAMAVAAGGGGRGSASTLPPPDLGVPQTARRTEAPPVSPANTDGRDGWLSDLLSRTDGGQQQPQRGRAPAGGANPLESLSLDIGRLMDRNLAAEMWDRYQRGESKAFTKRLYTPAGQKAFDEVARKYRADRGFKQTVDRYIAEFERLLDEVARDERGPQTLRAHLTSETGLVYTLLAHAAGRLG
jgi:hypothetical protein